MDSLEKKLLQGDIRKKAVEKMKLGKFLDRREIVKEVGYDNGVVLSKEVSTKSVFGDVMNEYFPNNYIARKIHQNFERRVLRKYVFAMSVPDEDIRYIMEESDLRLLKIIPSKNTSKKQVYVLSPDVEYNYKYLDMVNKLKGNYAPEQVTVTNKLEAMSDRELQAIIDANRRAEAIDIYEDKGGE